MTIHTGNDSVTEYRFAGFRLDARRKKLFGTDGELVALSARPFDALQALVERRGEIMSREELMEAVWPGVFVEENNLSQAVSTVRKALNDTTSESHFIRTVPGRGYCFIAPVEGVPDTNRQAPGGAAAAASARSWLRFGPLHSVVLALAVAIGLFALEHGLQPPAVAAVAESVPAPLGISDIPRPDSRIRNSIAVLPLSTMGDEGDALFAVGLHDEIISQLTQIRSLNVIARSSIVTLLEQGLSTLDVTRVLRVESSLSGTIRIDGAQARIKLQQVDVRTGVTVWSDAYDLDRRDLAQMISTQGDIALNVASALKAELPARDEKDAASLPTALFKAYRYNLAARNAHDHQNYAEEWHLAQKAIALDPDFYDALYTFASANIVLVASPLPGMSSVEHSQLALEHVGRMIELAPERSEGYALQAAALATRRDWAGVATALATLEEMHAPLPSLEYAGLVAMSLGDFDKAVAIYDASLLTEVLNPYARGFLMVALELSGRGAEAHDKYVIGQELYTQWWGESVNALLALGRNEAIGDVEQMVGISEELRQALLHHGDSEAIHAALAAYRRAPARQSIEALYYAALAAEVGEHDLAVELLRASMQGVWSNVFWVWLPVFDATRQQESFRALLRESGLVDHWQQHGWPRMCRPLEANDFRCDWRANAVAQSASR
jgi:DNA-binding winged helix-turn-helix (wHTH) protein/TolB-like protein